MRRTRRARDLSDKLDASAQWSSRCATQRSSSRRSSTRARRWRPWRANLQVGLAWRRQASGKLEAAGRRHRDVAAASARSGGGRPRARRGAPRRRGGAREHRRSRTRGAQGTPGGLAEGSTAATPPGRASATVDVLEDGWPVEAMPPPSRSGCSCRSAWPTPRRGSPRRWAARTPRRTTPSWRCRVDGAVRLVGDELRTARIIVASVQHDAEAMRGWVALLSERDAAPPRWRRATATRCRLCCARCTARTLTCSAPAPSSRTWRCSGCSRCASGRCSSAACTTWRRRCKRPTAAS